MGFRKQPLNSTRQHLEDIEFINKNRATERDAGISENIYQQPFVEAYYEIDLSISTLAGKTISRDFPMKITFPFRSFLIKNIDNTNSDGLSTFNMALNGVNISTDYVPMFANESKLSPYMWAEASLYWTPQPGRKLGIVFSTDAEMRSGNSSITGNVSVNNPSVIVTEAVTAPAATAFLICASEPTRQWAKILNQTGALLYYGPNNLVTPTIGDIIFHNQKEKSDAYGAIWGYSVAGGDIRLTRAY